MAVHYPSRYSQDQEFIWNGERMLKQHVGVKPFVRGSVAWRAAKVGSSIMIAASRLSATSSSARRCV